MTITHTISSIDESTGGPARSVSHLASALAQSTELSAIQLVTLESDHPILRSGLGSKVDVFFCKSSLMLYSKALGLKLSQLNTDLFHGHGLWEFPIHQMAKIARTRGLPYIVSIRGMLEPWSLTQGKSKKKIAMFLFQDNDLKNAACLHATGQMELKNIRDLGYKNAIADIPNGVKTEQFPMKDFSRNTEIRKILFLSRIHPKKGIEDLIKAWEELELEVKKNWIIEIAGNGDSNYINKLNDIIKKKELQNQIFIIGSKFGQDKIEIYHSADLFVLPTYSENFGIVVAEALCCGLPVITTKGTPWQELETKKAGKWIEIGASPLREALYEMMLKTDSERMAMGRNGRKLIEENYSIEAVAEKFIKVYQWILNKGQKPDFVYL
jgi:glycosyltransferase involved in cell wall biosynthesis